MTKLPVTTEKEVTAIKFYGSLFALDTLIKTMENADLKSIPIELIKSIRDDIEKASREP